MPTSFFSNKRVLITGADGFIGSHLTETLAPQCKSLKVLSQYNSFNNWGWLEGLPLLPDIEVVSGDVRDPFFCEHLCKDIDIIFHLAALIAIPYSYQAPQSYVDTNIHGTVNMCQAALKNSCEKIVHVSTSEVYGTAQYVPIDENHPLQPQSPYSASKISADALAKSYHLSFGLPLTIARPFNTYGPRQSARAVIPSIIGQLSQNKDFLDMGNLTPTRDFNFVKDTCNGFMEIASSDKTIGETINIATETEISILDLVKLIKELLQSNTEIRIKDERLRPEKSEVYRLLGSNKKIISLTDFTPQYSLKKGLLETIDWFQNPENQKKYKFNIYNR